MLWLTSWLSNPFMLGLGALAVASPIIIHLLNKRRFKIVEWAAMDFLFEADKKNRRRVQIENFLLLFLRCLAMLLIGMLLARPFLPSSVASALAQAKQYERVILLDDSLSQRVLNGTVPSIEVAKESIKKLIMRLADSDQTEDWVTLMVTSNPEEPLLSNEPLTKTTVSALSEIIDDIECSDFAADYNVSMGELKRYVSGLRENVGRVAYIFSDMRDRDWVGSTDAESGSTPSQLIKDIGESTATCFVIDTAASADQNLAVTSVRPENLQVADKIIRFNVSVTNFGEQTVEDVRVLLQVDEQPAEYETIASIAPGQTEDVAFRYMFNRPVVDEFELTDEQIENLPQFQNFRVKAEIDRQSMTQELLAADQLIEDSSAVYASRVLNDIRVLLVDGHPSSISERSETHYLKSIQVAGTGLQMDVVTVSDFERVSLSKYNVIFLCNVDEASADRVKSLKQWVEDSGSLVLMPGNQVQASMFNETFYEEGQGLSPIGLINMAGDATMSRWVNFEVDPKIHPSLQVIVESDATSLSKIDVFSWWSSKYDTNQLGKTFDFPIRLNDQDNSPVMVDRSWGAGRVIVFTIPADGDWTMWPSSVTYAVVFNELIDYLIGSSGDESIVALGGAINYPVDLSVYDKRVSLRDPKKEKIEAVARPLDDTEEAKNNVLYRIEFDGIAKRGFYELGLKRNSGETETVLFASNYDPAESQIKRVPQSKLEGDFFSDKVKLVSATDLDSQQVTGGNTEIWPQILIVLFVILVLEQFLGYWFGRKR